MHEDERPAHSPAPTASDDAASAGDRRGFLARATSLGMLAGLGASYGTAGVFAARYLYPARPRAKAWMYVARVADIAPGGSLNYTTPGGEKVAVARQAQNGTVDDFVALSSTCPHLGCQVHWESQNERFFCPCHNGTFDKSGKGTGGPPGDAGQSLPRYPLKSEGGLLYIEVPTESLEVAEAPPPRDGHDPCLGTYLGPHLADGAPV
jgi:cytochrome b6-f complex iron-sulfur subunit